MSLHSLFALLVLAAAPAAATDVTIPTVRDGSGVPQ